MGTEFGTGSVSGGADVDVWIDLGFSEIAAANIVGKGLGILLAHQIDGAAAEAASGHATPEKTGQSFGHFHHEVELFTTHGIEIAQAIVRLPHEGAERLQVSTRECAASLQYSLVFVNDVFATFINRRREVVGVFLELLGRDIAQSANLRIPLR